MGRRPAYMNPALIEPDYEVVVKAQSKKPRLTPIESTAMAALLSFRTAQPLKSESPNVEPNTKQPTLPIKAVTKKRRCSSNASTNVTDDEESICSRQSQVSLPPTLGTRSLVTEGSPPPLNKALVKPMLPSFKAQRKMALKMPQGRPLRSAPGLAKHLVKQTRPICLKLSP